jgi:hypothetical protein
LTTRRTGIVIPPVQRALGVGIALALAAAASGCGMLSDSSRSLSKSVSSPLRSSGSSSDQQDLAYMREIRDFSFGYAKSGGDPQAFSRGIGSLAHRHGVTDWHSDPETCTAVGQGFRAAGLDRTTARRFNENLVRPGTRCADWIRNGYEDLR